MRPTIAVLVEGQFGVMTGIQFYVDSLLSALYELAMPYQLVAFLPCSPLRPVMAALNSTTRYKWLRHEASRLDLAGVVLRPAALAHPTVLTALGVGLAESRVGRSLRWRTWRVRSRLRGKGLDLLHVPSPAFWDFNVLRGRTNVATIYDLTTRLVPWAHTPDNIAVAERMYDYARRNCARILAISEATKRDIVSHLGIPAARVDVTPLAPRASVARIDDATVVGRLLRPLGLGNRPFVLYAGTLEPRKNLCRLVRAFNIAVSEHRLPHLLVLCGGTFLRHDEEIRRLSSELGIGQRVVQTGYVSDMTLNALMSACDAFAYVSEYEGFGLPPLEAMACGAPVVASNTSSLPEVVGDAALKVLPDSINDIAAALSLLLTSMEENTRRRALALQRASQFTWRRTAELTLKSYAMALSDG